MKRFAVGAMSLSLALAFVVACGGGDSDSSGDLTAPTNLKATTVEGKPHLTWTDAMNEESYMIERMDHAVSPDWVPVKGAEELVPNSVQYHDATADSAKSYMYRVMAMKGDQSKLSNEVSWP
jgi:endo-1,4-beta-D-glucanase Y